MLNAINGLKLGISRHEIELPTQRSYIIRDEGLANNLPVPKGLCINQQANFTFLKCESGSSRFQPGKGPRGPFRDSTTLIFAKVRFQLCTLDTMACWLPVPQHWLSEDTSRMEPSGNWLLGS